MTTLDQAIQLDVAGLHVDAADGYEAVLRADGNCVSALVNLTVLYWQSTEFGFSAGHSLPSEFVHRAADRLRSLLDQVGDDRSAGPEMTFWKKYIAWADYGEPLPVQDCLQLLADHPTYLEPTVYVFGATEGRQNRAEALELVRLSSKQATVRNRYVVSVLNSALGQLPDEAS